MAVLKSVVLTEKGSAPSLLLDFGGGAHVSIVWSAEKRSFMWGMFRGDSDGDPEPDCLDSGMSSSAVAVVRKNINTLPADDTDRMSRRVAVHAAVELERRCYGLYGYGV